MRKVRTIDNTTHLTVIVNAFSDPNAQAQGFIALIAYIDPVGIQSSLKALVEVGAEVVQDALDVGTACWWPSSRTRMAMLLV